MSGASPNTTTPAPTPFMVQYQEIKARHRDALLFFRMGDFYELFFEDAEVAASALDITLTARGQHKGDPIPMAGVPHHAAEAYLARLIRAGHRVAVCEQLEDPAAAKARGSKAVVKRGVVRVVTPGTLTEDTLLDSRSANVLAAVGLAAGGAEAALALADVSTGRLEIFVCSPDTLGEELAAVAPSEIVVGEAAFARPAVSEALQGLGVAVAPRPGPKSDAKTGERLLKEAFGVASLDAFGGFERAELSAAGLLLDYLALAQAGGAPRLDPPKRRQGGALMAIDPATRASLEIDRALQGGRKGSLLAAVDRTVTAPGARLLADRLSRPLTDVAEINARLDAVTYFVDDRDRREAVRAQLQAGADIERARMRLKLGRGGPRDLVALKAGLAAGERASARMVDVLAGPPAELAAAARALNLSDQPDLADFVAQLDRALTPDPPATVRDGGFIAPGFDPALDDTRNIRDDSRKIIAQLQADYIGKTGVSSLKIKHNNVLGYFIDVTARNAGPIAEAPLNETFIHRQTLASAVRFTTAELADLDGRIARAEEEARARELAIFDQLVAASDALSAQIGAAAEGVACIDAASGLAEWAAEASAVRPQVDDSLAFEAEAARHPVVEASLRKAGDGFTANDCVLDAQGELGPRLMMVTGPNMAGKSTYLRQNVLLAILAQAGSFVPAKRLRLGVVDRVFSRVGASDDLSRGRSTFMVEMIETAAILNQSGPRALVILDEVGRGTATYDGLAIAWATAEHLHDVNKCRAIFATHYHELTDLADRLDYGANASLRAKDWNGELVFLHDVGAGAADKSYGVQVARLAGLPAKAVARAETVLERLEGDGASQSALDDLPLFAGMVVTEHVSEPSAADKILGDVDPDSLTAREALDLVYTLKSAAAGEN